MTRLLTALMAAATLAALIVAPPWLLVHFIGNPYPAEGVSLTAPLTDDALVGVLAVVVWVLWAQLMLCIIVEAAAALSDDRVRLRAPLTLGVQQQLARRLVSALIMLTISTPVAAVAGGGAATLPAPGGPDADASRTGPSHTTSTTLGQGRRDPARPDAPIGPSRPEGHDSQGEGSPSTISAAPSSSLAPAHRGRVAQDAPDGLRARYLNSSTVTVMRLDSLWSIAERILGDGDRWSEIAELNEGEVMSDGTRFVSADHIRPGWQLRVPHDATPTAGQGPVFTNGRQVVVEAGDTLSGIAAAELGDPDAYPAIVEASASITQPGGQHLSDPDVIDIGWRLTIPEPHGTATPDHETSHAEALHSSDGQRAHPTGDQEAEIARAGAERSSRPARPGHDESPAEPPGQRQPQQREAPSSTAANAPREVSGAAGAAEIEAAGSDAPPWMLAGLAGGGAVLAGGLLLGLRTRRRAQVRNRRPGRAIASPPAALAAVEKSITVSTRPAATVEDIDAALRRLAVWSAATATPMPALAAVELRAGRDRRLILHLASPARLGDGWADEQGDGLHWVSTDSAGDPTNDPTTDRANDRGHDGADDPAPTGGVNGPSDDDPDAVDAPYPLLVTVGSTPVGDLWLLNCEELGEIRFTGDQTRCADFIRYLIAEVAMNPWSHQAEVDCLGVGAEVAPMNPDRITYRRAEDLRDRAAIENALSDVLAEAQRTAHRATASRGTVSTGRTGQLDADAWPARLLILKQPSADNIGALQLRELRELIRNQPGCTATAVLLLEDHDRYVSSRAATACSGPAGRVATYPGVLKGEELCDTDPGVEMRIDADGNLVLAIANLTLSAVGLSAEEAAGCTTLLAQADEASEVVDTEVPYDEAVTEGWESYADAAGALRREHTLAEDLPREGVPEKVESILPASAEDYLREGAITKEDLASLAPQVPARIRDEVESVDPELDNDLADWFDQNCRRPRLQVLGPVVAHAYGKPLAKQRAYITELLAYLVLRRRTGATPGDVATAFNISPGKTRDYVRVLRSWLGDNPRTGEPYLPHADKALASKSRGVSVYQIDQDVLVDADLFRRLRVRGEARGAEGIDDLRRALLLVSGRPFDQLREDGWTWLIDGDRLDHHLSPAVADVAFLVTTHSLERHELSQARAAAEIGALAAPDEEATRLCLARVCEAEGRGAEAERILREEVCNRVDDHQAPADLSERTAMIIRRHRWLETPAPHPHASSSRTTARSRTHISTADGPPNEGQVTAPHRKTTAAS